MIPIKIISPRIRKGSLAADQYAMVGPTYTGGLSSKFDEDHIIRSSTRFNYILGRTRVFDQDDHPDAIAVQNGFTLTTPSRVAKFKLPILPFVDSQEIISPIPEPQVYFFFANTVVQYLKIEDNEIDTFKRFAKIEVGPSREFVGQHMSEEKYSAIRKGIADGSKEIDDVIASAADVVVRGWSDRYKPELSPGVDSLVRAAYVKITIFPNVPKEETFHLSGWQDTDGDLLDSTKHNYTLTFPPDHLPKVLEEYGGFWSITVYAGAGTALGPLVHSPIDRYAVYDKGSELVRDADGTLKLYFQNKRPDTDEKAANWLPTPDPEFYSDYKTGEFHVEIRIYLIEDINAAPYYPPGFEKNPS